MTCICFIVIYVLHYIIAGLAILIGGICVIFAYVFIKDYSINTTKEESPVDSIQSESFDIKKHCVDETLSSTTFHEIHLAERLDMLISTPFGSTLSINSINYNSAIKQHHEKLETNQ